jgi:hypothetical protein
MARNVSLTRQNPENLALPLPQPASESPGADNSRKCSVLTSAQEVAHLLQEQTGEQLSAD